MKESPLKSSFKMKHLKDNINLMLDIETLSTKSNATIVSIAGVFWRNYDPKPLSTCYLNLCVDEQLTKWNRIADWDTIKWWTGQPNAQAFDDKIDSHSNVYQEILNDPMIAFQTNERILPEEALCELATWIDQNCINFGIDQEKELFVWSKSPSFDLVILQSFYDQLKLGKIGSFWNWRDVRSFVSFDTSYKNQARNQIDNSHLTPHLPIDDCLLQINEVCEIHKIHQQMLKFALDD